MKAIKHEDLPAGTRVLNTNDGDLGVIQNGSAFDPKLGWTEYEVETQSGTERWEREDISVLIEFDDDEAAEALFGWYEP